jgi:GNAT superfamily N-acetyltransferase
MSGATNQKASRRPEKVTVRRAEYRDAEAIHALIVELARARDSMDKVASSVADIARDGFGSDPAFEALMAEIDGAPVGLCLYFSSYSTWRGQRGLYVQDLVVAQRARGLGAGARLLAAAAALGKARGCGYLRLSVEADNERARAFYARHGLSHSEAERIYLLDDMGFDALAAAAEESPA